MMGGPIQKSALPRRSEGAGGSYFAADPQKSFETQTVFWAPEVLPTLLPVSSSASPAAWSAVLNLTKLSPDQLRRGSDGWYAVMRLRGISPRPLPRDGPAAGVPFPA